MRRVILLVVKSGGNYEKFILIDGIYTKDVNVIEDCAQMLFELGAKSVTIYIVAKTR